MRFMFPKEEEDEEESVKIMFYLYFVPCVIIQFFACSYFLTCLHLDAIRSLKVKTVNILMYGYNAGPPMAIPIYTVLPYCVIIEAVWNNSTG